MAVELSTQSSINIKLTEIQQNIGRITKILRTSITKSSNALGLLTSVVNCDVAEHAQELLLSLVSDLTIASRGVNYFNECYSPLYDRIHRYQQVIVESKNLISEQKQLIEKLSYRPQYVSVATNTVSLQDSLPVPQDCIECNTLKGRIVNSESTIKLISDELYNKHERMQELKFTIEKLQRALESKKNEKSKYDEENKKLKRAIWNASSVIDAQQEMIDELRSRGRKTQLSSDNGSISGNISSDSASRRHHRRELEPFNEFMGEVNEEEDEEEDEDDKYDEYDDSTNNSNSNGHHDEHSVKNPLVVSSSFISNRSEDLYLDRGLRLPSPLVVDGGGKPPLPPTARRAGGDGSRSPRSRYKSSDLFEMNEDDTIHCNTTNDVTALSGYETNTTTANANTSVSVDSSLSLHHPHQSSPELYELDYTYTSTSTSTSNDSSVSLEFDQSDPNDSMEECQPINHDVYPVTSSEQLPSRSLMESSVSVEDSFTLIQKYYMRSPTSSDDSKE